MPTQNPVPSGDVGDLLFNIKKVDEIVTSSAVKYTDRLGVERYTIEGIRQNLAPLGKVYDDLSSANAAIASGEIPIGSFFFIRSVSDNSIADEYQNVAGIATATGESYPSTSFVEEVNVTATEANERVNPDYSGDGISVIDSSRFPSFSSVDGIYLPDFGITTVPYDGIFLVDKNGFALEAKFEDGDEQSSWVEETTASMEIIGAQSRSAVAAGRSNVVTLLADLIHFILYGQSLQNGTEGQPAMSITQPFDNLMFGQSVMPASPTAPAFTPRGGATLNPLIATCADASGNVLTPEQVAALAPGTIAYGETPGESAINSLRRSFLDYIIQSTDPNRKFVASAAGVGGRTAAQLSKGASPNLYQRYLDAMSGVNTIASGESKSYQVGGFIYIQGENDYPSNTKDVYKATTNTILSNMQADRIMPPGETRASGIFMVQTGASFTVDTHDMAIGMAQIEISNERDDVYLVGGYYPYTDKNGHLDSNGYRWLGEKIAEIMFKVIVLREDWKPIQPLKAVYRGADVLIAKHVPAPPLRIEEPYVINTATTYPDLGFTAIDRVSGVDTRIAIKSVKISGLSTIHISLERAPVGELIIRYADKTYHNGNGMICDSSNGLSLNKYTYMPGSGMYPSANIPALVDKNYDLRNWSVAYQITAEEDE